MVNEDFLDALSDCIDRLNRGQSITDCARSYPQHAAELRLRLETRPLMRRIQPNIMEIAQARERVRFRLESHQRQRRLGFALGRVVGVAFLVLILVLASTEVLAENSLPGDSLYGVKRLTENIRAAFASSSELAHEQLATRRIEEITRLLALKRSADVDFEGSVQAIGISDWRVAGFTLRVMPDIPGAAAVQVGDTITVRAATTMQGELIAKSLTVIHTEIPTPAPSPTLTSSPTARVTETLAPTLTSRPPVLSVTVQASPTPVSVTAATKTRVPITATPRPVSNGSNRMGGSGSGSSGGSGSGSGGSGSSGSGSGSGNGPNAGSSGSGGSGSGSSGSGSGNSGGGSGSGNGSGSGSGGRGGSH